MIAQVLLDLDPNVVKPGWTPALITLGLAIAIALLYLSMRNQVRRINVPYADADPEPDGETETTEVETDPAAGPTATADPPEVDAAPKTPHPAS